MNTAKKLAPFAEACTTLEFEQTIAGHTLHFVTDRLKLMLGLWNALPSREYWIWDQLMVRVKEFRSFEIKISHKTLCDYSSMSEASIRGILNRLSALGFLEIVNKTVSHFGKNYILRPALPRYLLPKLKTELDRCRKDKPRYKKYTSDKTPSEKAPIHPNRVSDVAPSFPVSSESNTAVSSTPANEIAFDKNAQQHYISWEGEVLSEKEAYLPIPVPEKSSITPPYQPRGSRLNNWMPSLKELLLVAGPDIQSPDRVSDKNLLIDIADWLSKLNESFLRQAYCERGSTDDSFVKFLLKTNAQFPEYLKSILPQGAKECVSRLLERLESYTSPRSNAWFPITQGILNQQQKDYEYLLNNRGIEKPKPTLSPQVAVSIPTTLLKRIISTVKTLKLSQEKVLELAYHAMHFQAKKVLPNEEEKQKYNLCLAVKFIKENRWSCPISLENKRTRYLEGAVSC